MKRTTLSLVGVALLLCATAYAQTPDAELLRLFREGNTLAEQGRYGEAVERYQRALTVRESPEVRFNLAVALVRGGRYLEGRAMITEVERVTGGRMRPENRATLDELTATVARSLARVRVEATPADANVSVDARPVAASAGVREVEVDPGSHVFRAECEGYEAASVTRQVAPGERATVELRLAPREATWTIEASVASAEVWVDGRAVGAGRYAGALRPGAHVVEVRADGYRTWRAEVTLRPGANERERVSLERAASPGLHTRWWFWTGVGVVAIGAAVASFFLFSTLADPYAGTLGTVTDAISVGGSR